MSALVGRDWLLREPRILWEIPKIVLLLNKVLWSASRLYKGAIVPFLTFWNSVRSDKYYRTSAQSPCFSLFLWAFQSALAAQCPTTRLPSGKHRLLCLSYNAGWMRWESQELSSTQGYWFSEVVLCCWEHFWEALTHFFKENHRSHWEPLLDLATAWNAHSFQEKLLPARISFHMTL